jgi:hypothetical protein
MNTDEQIASLFYDASDHTDEPAEVEAPAQQDDVAATLFDTAPKAEHEGLHDRRAGMSDAFGVDDVYDPEGQLDAEHKQTLVEIVHDIAAEAELPSMELREIATLGKQIAAEPPTEQTLAEWAGEASRQLVDRAGGDIAEAERDLAAAREFVQARPALGALLEATGLGSHPVIVQRVVEASRRAKLRG